MSWPMVKLKDVASFIRGITFKPDDVIPVDSAGAVACMRTKNVQEQIDLSDVWGIPRSFVKRPDQFVCEGDLLVSTANSWNLVGKCCWVPVLPWPTTVGGFIAALRGSDRVYPRYLYHWFASSDVQARVRNCARQTTNIANLSFDRCLDLSLPLPPLPEQERIAAILDQADDLRRKRALSLQYARSAISALYNKMFGQEKIDSGRWVTLEDLISKNDSINYGVVQPGAEVEDGVPLVRVGDLLHPSLNRSNLRNISVDVESAYRRSRLNGLEILIACVGSIGAIALATMEMRGFNIARAVARVPVDPLIADRIFISTQLKSERIQRYFKSETRTVAQPTLNIKQIKETKIYLPPLSDQHEFGRQAHEISLSQRSIGQSQMILDALFTSLQHCAFRGEL